MKQQPLQPLLKDEDGIIRFQKNEIVAYLYNWAARRSMGLNELASMPFSRADREQFAQLLGYSLAGFNDLSYVRDKTFERVEKKAERLKE